MSELALKYDNNAFFQENYTQKLLMAFKIAFSCCFGLRRNLDFPDFLQKMFYNINYWYTRFYATKEPYDARLRNCPISGFVCLAISQLKAMADAACRLKSPVGNLINHLRS